MLKNPAKKLLWSPWALTGLGEALEQPQRVTLAARPPTLLP